MSCPRPAISASGSLLAVTVMLLASCSTDPAAPTKPADETPTGDEAPSADSVVDKPAPSAEPVIVYDATIPLRREPGDTSRGIPFDSADLLFQRRYGFIDQDGVWVRKKSTFPGWRFFEKSGARSPVDIIGAPKRR